jgi:hypothetical protein
MQKQPKASKSKEKQANASKSKQKQAQASNIKQNKQKQMKTNKTKQMCLRATCPGKPFKSRPWASTLALPGLAKPR